MNVGAILVGIALLVGGGAYVARPLFDRRLNERQSRDLIASPRGQLINHRDAIYALIRELDADFQTGKINSEDYQTLRGRYVAQGVAILKQLDELSSQNSRAALESEIEARVLALRQARGTSDQAPVARFCTQCGHAADPGDHFCAHCGTSLKGAAPQ